MAASVAGCSQNPDSTTDSKPTGTEPATTPQTASRTEPPTATETASPTPTLSLEEAWTVDRLSGRVETLLLPEAGPIEAPAGPLYAATAGGEVARIDSVSGRPDWHVSVHGESDGTPALTPPGGTVYAISETFTDDRLAGHVEALNPGTGEVDWRFDDRYFLRVLGEVEDLVVVAGEHIRAHPEEIGPNEAIRGDGRLYGLDRSTGDERWTVEVPELRGADVATHGVYAAETRDRETNQLALRAFDLDGTDRWRIGTGTINPAAPLATDDFLLAGAGTNDDTNPGGVGRYDPADGSLRWRVGTWGRGPADLALVDGRIHAGGRPLLVLDPDGERRYRLQEAVVTEVPATPETLYNGAGTQILAVDRASGVVRWRYRPIEYDHVHLRTVLADHVVVDHGIGNDREVVLLEEAAGDVVGVFETPDYYYGTVGAGSRLFAGVGSDVIAYDLPA